VRLSEWWTSALLPLVVAIGCNDATLTGPPATTPPRVESDGGSSSEADGGGRPTGPDAGRGDAGMPAVSNLRVVAGNLSSGATSTYDAGEGIRILKGLRPDIALLQELNYKSNAKADLDAFVTEAFGAGYEYHREDGVQIPNGVVSRYPILTSGRWADPQVDNRGFVYAKIDIPGPRDLWAVSVHFLTSSSSNRSSEATSLVAQLGAVVADGDFVVIGGDLNTQSRTEPCITTLAQIVRTAGPWPADQDGNDNTNGPRNAPYDWVLEGAALGAFQVPTSIGANEFPDGLVFDSRAYSPLEDVAPIMATDSAAQNMQHMAVVKDFAVPE
jgi:endonuclease/exonuclease/phosphatase family metal-dependent hydrolase